MANGAARLFTGEAITLDALMASACLPDLFAAVEIEGEDYWDGGFSANPALEPLIFGDADATDVLIVQITPFMDDDVSASLTGVMARMSDIGFNACLLRDLKALTEVQAIAREAGLDGGAVLTGTDIAALDDAATAYADAQKALTAGNLGEYQTKINQMQDDLTKAQRALGR